MFSGNKALEERLKQVMEDGYNTDSARSTQDESIIQNSLFMDPNISLELNKLRIERENLEYERQLLEKENQKIIERLEQTSARLGKEKKIGERKIIEKEENRKGNIVQEMSDQEKIMRKETSLEKPDVMKAGACSSEWLSERQKIIEHQYIDKKDKELKEALEICNNENSKTKCKLRIIQEYKEYIEEAKLQIANEKKKPNNSSKNTLEINKRTVKLFEDEIIIEERESEIAQQNADSALESIQQISDELKLKADKSEIQKVQESIIKFREKTNEVKQGREVGEKIKALKCIAKKYQDNRVETLEKIKGIMATERKEINEICLEIKNRTKKLNENRFSYEEDIKELKGLKAIEDLNLSNPIRERIAELNQKITTKEKELGVMEVKKLEEIEELSKQLKKTENIFLEQIEINNKIFQIEESKLKEIKELMAIEAVKELLALRDPSKENASNNAALPASELQLKGMSEEERLNKIKFYERIVNEAEETVKNCDEILKSSNSETPTEILAIIKKKNAEKLIDNFSYQKYKVLGVPENLNSHRSGIVVAGAFCGTEDKKLKFVERKGALKRTDATKRKNTASAVQTTVKASEENKTVTNAKKLADMHESLFPTTVQTPVQEPDKNKAVTNIKKIADMHESLFHKAQKSVEESTEKNKSPSSKTPLPASQSNFFRSTTEEQKKLEEQKKREEMKGKKASSVSIKH